MSGSLCSLSGFVQNTVTGPSRQRAKQAEPGTAPAGTSEPSGRDRTVPCCPGPGPGRVGTSWPRHSGVQDGPAWKPTNVTVIHGEPSSMHSAQGYRRPGPGPRTPGRSRGRSVRSGGDSPSRQRRQRVLANHAWSICSNFAHVRARHAPPAAWPMLGTHPGLLATVPGHLESWQISLRDELSVYRCSFPSPPQSCHHSRKPPASVDVALPSPLPIAAMRAGFHFPRPYKIGHLHIR